MNKAIIFDMDGVLLDSMPAWGQVGISFVQKRGIEPPADLRETLKPMGLEQTAVYFKERFGFGESPQAIVSEIYELVADGYLNSFKLKDGVRQFMYNCYDAGIPAAVATATSTPLAQRAFRRLEVDEYIRFVISCDDVGKSKADPLIYQLAAQRLGVTPEETTVFEDAYFCAQTAKKAGFTVVGVYDESASEQEQAMRALCDRYIMSFEELL
ncbi:MAG: HAD family phosphatase [Clostridia bacterium]|nr:HAD family phosphatase [Clostridia bacterium]MDD4798706.1 HAD family phosphatase [Clostridia bacterium]